MGVTVHIKGDKRLDEIPLKGPELMLELGLLAERLIRTRTEQQVDVNGAPFRPLSAAYARAKADAGLPPIPNLTVSGRMLNDMAVTEVTERTVSIGFLSSGGVAPRTGRGKKAKSTANTFIQKSRLVGSADKAEFHTDLGAGRTQVKREFFALSEADEDKLSEALDAYLDRVMR